MSAIQVIDRAARLLEALSIHEGWVSLKILTAEADLHPSTAFRILRALNENGFVDRDNNGSYRLGARFLRLGARVHERLDLLQEARPIMISLRDLVGETVNLTVREGDEVVYVERFAAKRTMRVEQIIGSRALLHVTAVGKLMLGDSGVAACRAYAKRTRMKAYTRNTITDVAALLNVAQEAHRIGYAFDDEEAELGVGCIGVLIRDHNHAVVGGLSISAPIERRTREWIPILQEAGKNLSERLGYLSVSIDK